MYSSFEDEEITIVDEEGLKEEIRQRTKAAKAAKANNRWDTLPIDSSYYWCSLKLGIDSYEKGLFSAFDGQKIQGYWYAGWCRFLVEIAKYIEGTVSFCYEGGFPFRIIFEHGRVKVEYVPPDTWEVMSFEELLAYGKYKKSDIKEIERERQVISMVRSL